MRIASVRRRALWVCFLAIDFLLAAALCEAWIRWFVPVKNICYLTDSELGVTFCPNQKTCGYVEPGYSNTLITNSAGFHDQERTTAKAPGIYRIEVYGDSMVQGYVVPAEATLTAALEKHLNSKGLPVTVEVLNMGSGDDGQPDRHVPEDRPQIQTRPGPVLLHG